MNHTHKRALTLALLITATQTTHTLNYRDMTMLASGAIATAITGKMLYNFMYPETDQAMIARTTSKCQKAKKMHDDILLNHEHELSILDQDSNNLNNIHTFNRIKKSVKPTSDDYSLYHYINNIEYEIAQLQETIEELVHMQCTITHRSSTSEDRSLSIDFENSTFTIQTYCAQLQELINNLSNIRARVVNTAEYAYELKQYERSQETEEVEESLEDKYPSKYKNNVEIQQDEERMKAPDATVTTVSAPEIIAVSVETTTVESSSRASFNSDWCDATNPFNS